jgi:hypothetical protein
MNEQRLKALLLSFAKDNNIEVNFNQKGMRNGTYTVDFILGTTDQSQLDFGYSFKYKELK